jgi:hypothetical protein
MIESATPPRYDRNYITVGSSKDEVLAIQGTPTEFTDSVFSYGYSMVFFKDGKVSTWDNTRSTPLKVSMQPMSTVDWTKDHFAVGSSKDEVLAVQGTPTQFTDSVFTYGYSKVFFKDGKVSTWNDSRSNPLKVRMTSGKM